MNKNSTPQYTIDPLFDFQALCDTDIGLYRLIKQEYYDKSIFKSEIFEDTNERFIKTLLLTRRHFNPLFIFCKDNVMTDEEIDDLYKEFLNEEYSKILSLSSITGIFNIASLSNSTNKLVNVKVLCKSDEEVDWVHKYSYKMKCIVSSYENFDITKYDTIYIKYLDTLLLFNQESIKNKNIIFSKFLFNMEPEITKVDMPLIKIAKNYYKNNKFITADPYKDIVIPVSEMK